MAKKKYRGKSNTKQAASIQKVNKSLTKKGKIKGHNKKETKVLRASCGHHIFNKKGELVPHTWNNGDCLFCRMCRKPIHGEYFTEEEVKDRVAAMDELIQQSKFMSIAANTGKEMVDYNASLCVAVSAFPKQYKKIVNVARRTDSAKKKNKHKRNNGSMRYGSWSTK